MSVFNMCCFCSRGWWMKSQCPKESLHGGDDKTVAALRAYHDANYCAPRMNLVMISNSTVSEQLRVARERFGKVRF
eukprot:6001155-Amphidinium_carterae.1